MPEPNIQENIVQGAATAYGDGFLTNDFPIDDPYVGALLLPERAQKKHRFEFWITPAVDEEDRKASVSDWSENEDPFTQTGLLSEEEDQVRELIFQIRKSLSIRYHEILANRLLTLFNDAKEEDSASLGIALGSLRNFHLFLQEYTKKYPNLKYPNITLTPDNNIYTSWRGKQNRVFSVHFLPNGITNFVIFKPNDRHPEQPIRLSGMTTSDTLMKTVAPLGVNDWILE
jgi:hypothetical protein